ncbi:MAG: cell filamentation protein Fic [Alphaproteobacteria bacterium 41-28]|nr:MAG: cell filamentation protein Fic [Alphaproteobacteria bacterium 41-28]
MYIYELPDWPHFTWNHEKVYELLAPLRHQQGHLIGRMEALGFQFRERAALQTLTQDVLKSSEIEGEILDSEQVRSSLARRLGMDIGGLIPTSRDVDGVVDMMLDATQHYDQPLTKERLFDWHAALFSTGYSGLIKIKVGAWREDSHGPMQVVSGPFGRGRVHYQAPAADKVDYEMGVFLDWFNRETTLDPVLKAGLAHLWFVTIHPFDDGNGRIARAIGDMALAQSEKSPQRFYSLSSQIRSERSNYYKMLERTQKGSLDVTSWMKWFLSCLERAIQGAEGTLESVLLKARFWEKLSSSSLNARQRKILNLMLDGFEGKLTTSKWAKLTKCSQDTAYRDILALVDQGILKVNPGGGRSTSYSLGEF